MEVSEKVKQQYQGDSIQKNIIVTFPDLGLTVTNSGEGAHIQEESLHLTESILNKSDIEFVGCIASRFSIQIRNFYEKIKGQRISVSIYTEDTEDEPIPLFHGIVDSAIMQSNKRIKEVTAYDQLYTKGNIDVSAWYNSLSFPITLKDFRDSLFSYLGIEQMEIVLPNDAVSIDKKYDPKSLKALNVIKAVCQINGAFGIINRQDKFEYRILTDISAISAYPGTSTYPAFTLFPADPEALTAAGNVESFAFYKNVNFEEYEVKPVDKLTIRQSEDDAGVSFGSGTNNYIIQGNMFTLGKSSAELLAIAERIYYNVQGVYYHPYESDNNGLPWIECGVDAVSYYMIDFIQDQKSRSTGTTGNTRNFYVFSRELTGIQALRDEYSAEGEEYQTEFITDLQTQIDMIKTNVQEAQESTYDKDYLDEQFNDIWEVLDSGGGGGSGGGGISVVSTDSLPSTLASNTLYLIQGEVLMI